MLLMDDANAAVAAEAAERLRLEISTTTFCGISVTSSFGVASLAMGAADPHELLNKADQALYGAKRSGRNRVIRHDAMSPELLEPPTNPEPRPGVESGSQPTVSPVLSIEESKVRHPKSQISVMGPPKDLIRPQPPRMNGSCTRAPLIQSLLEAFDSRNSAKFLATIRRIYSIAVGLEDESLTTACLRLEASLSAPDDWMRTLRLLDELISTTSDDLALRAPEQPNRKDASSGL